MDSGWYRLSRTWVTTFLFSILVLAFAVFTGGSGCPPGDDDDDNDDVSDDDDDNDVADDDDDDDDDDVADDDDDTAIEPFSLAGDVYLIPTYYEWNDADQMWYRMELEWTEVSPGGYPYGRIYVGVTSDFGDTDSFLHYTSPTVPADPKNDPTPFAFAPATWALAEVAVMAIADTWYDTIISPWDEMNYHADKIDTTGPPVTDADIFIDVEHVWNGSAWVPGSHGGVPGQGGGSWPGGPGGPGGGGGGGGGCCGDDDDDDDGGGGGGNGWPGNPNVPVGIAGDIALHESVFDTSSGNSLVAVYDEDEEGPWWFTFPGVLDGANQDVGLPWSMTINSEFYANMHGAWDWNNNGMFEPGDEWGATVDALGGSQINPWWIGVTDITDMLVQCPLEHATPPLPEPYVRVTGIVQTDGSFEFSDLDPDDAVIVFGNRQSVVEGDTLGELISTGQIVSFDFIPNVAGLGVDQVPYEVWVPTHSTSFIMAGIDVDGDGNYAADPTETVVAVHIDESDVIRNITLVNAP